MLYEDVYTLGSPGTFDITDKDNPLYYIARYCHEMSVTLYNLNDEGFQFRQMTAADFLAYHDSWGDLARDYGTWLVSAVAASEAGTAIPALPAREAYANNPIPAALPGIAIEFLVRVMLIWLRKKLDSDTDATEIAQVLKRALLKEDGGGDEFAILEQLSNTPLEIVVSAEQGFEDVVYSDRPET